MTLDRKQFDEIEQTLRDIRDANQHGVIVSFGANQNPDCGDRGAVTVSIQKGGQTATSEALHLYDAYLMATHKVDRMVDAENARAAKEKESA